MAETRDELGAQIHLLGDLLGETIIEQEGQTVFELVESIRSLAKASRAGDTAAGQRLLDLVDSLPIAWARPVVKSFAAYFQLVNLAEEEERVRVLHDRAGRAYARGEPMDETIAVAVSRLRDEGLGAAEVQSLLDHLFIMPVFTAHPTEAKRRTVLTKLNRIRDALHELDFHMPTPDEAATVRETLREEIVALWQTDDTRQRQPTVLDEVRNGLYYFDTPIFDLAPRLHRELQTRAEPLLSARPIPYPHFFALRELDRRGSRRQSVRDSRSD